MAFPQHNRVDFDMIVIRCLSAYLTLQYPDLKSPSSYILLRNLSTWVHGLAKMSKYVGAIFTGSQVIVVGGLEVDSGNLGRRWSHCNPAFDG